MLHALAYRLLLALVLCASALLALPGASNAAAQRAGKAGCAGTHAQPAPGNLPTVRAAVLCLHNRVRSAHGLRPLKEHRKLRKAAKRHSKHMVAGRFFAHDSPSGTGMADRILRTGYASRRAWSVGENIAWATGGGATAAQIQRAWMRSPGHRANILQAGYREIGIGIALGAPVAGPGGDAATYTTDFGARR